MTKPALLILLIWLSARGAGETQQQLCPRHIETPTFPQIARAAHLAGKVSLTVTIDADGKVTNVGGGADTFPHTAHALLQKSAAENMRLWTFANATSTPQTQVIVYDYEIDPSLPPEGGRANLPAITRVTFDLPDHVTIATNSKIIDTAKSSQR